MINPFFLKFITIVEGEKLTWCNDANFYFYIDSQNKIIWYIFEGIAYIVVFSVENIKKTCMIINEKQAIRMPKENTINQGSL